MAGHLMKTIVSPKGSVHKYEFVIKIDQWDYSKFEKYIIGSCENRVWYRLTEISKGYGKRGTPYESILELWFRKKSDAMMIKLVLTDETFNFE